MTQEEAIKTLVQYKGELTDILGRFTKDRSGIHIGEHDDARFREVSTELNDFFCDEFVDDHYGAMVRSQYTAAIANMSGSASYHGVQTMCGLVASAIVRIQRNPGVLSDSAPLLTAKHNTDALHVQLINLWERFHHVVRLLRDRRQSRPTLDVNDEYDVQDLFQALLATIFNDIRKEDWAPTHAGAASRLDFLLPEIEAVVELKMMRQSLSTKDLGDQLIVDIERYKKHPQCRMLYCFVYDPTGRVINPRGIEKDLNRDNQQEMPVRVMIVP